MKKVSKKTVLKLFPKRTKLSNKADAGKVLVIGGGHGLIGAGILASLSSTRSGAGYTYLLSDVATYPWQKFPDFIVAPLALKELKNKKDFSIAIGPGLGTKSPKKKILSFLLKEQYPHVTIDADALTILAELKNAHLPSTWILTPHEGELAKLLGTTSKKIKSDRLKFLVMAQKKYRCHVLLKGAQTLLINPAGEIVAVDNSTPALAKAGTGDVLLGIITAMRAQNLSAFDAMKVGCYIHGWASREWLKMGHNPNSLRPTDLIDLISIFPKSAT